jgi:hypothetical protein
MRSALWGVFFVICNIVGVEVFKAALTLPFEEAIVPRFLVVPLIGLAAFSAARVAGSLKTRDQ